MRTPARYAPISGRSTARASSTSTPGVPPSLVGRALRGRAISAASVPRCFTSRSRSFYSDFPPFSSEKGGWRARRTPASFLGSRPRRGVFRRRRRAWLTVLSAGKVLRRPQPRRQLGAAAGGGRAHSPQSLAVQGRRSDDDAVPPPPGPGCSRRCRAIARKDER